MEEVIIEGKVENIIFQNEDNGYVVFVASINDLEIVCTGIVLNLMIGESIKLFGNFVMHPSYGKQFNIKNYEKNIPTTLAGLEKYLASGIIPGIGKKTAKRIIDTLNDEAFDILENHPEKLAKVKGISLKKAMTINEFFVEQVQFRNILMFLQQLNISPTLSLKIYKKYKGRTIDIIKTDPYRLADEVLSIGFKIADEIAYSLGIPKDSIFRIRAGIKYILNEASTNGHVFLPFDILKSNTQELLVLEKEKVELEIINLASEKKIYIRNIENYKAVYLSFFYYAESYSAKRLIELALNKSDNTKNVLKIIEALEIENNIKLASKQLEAITEALDNGVLIITGGPGTGKTTTINTLIGVLENIGYNVVLTAPTGRAAKRMTEATGKEAKTIHRLLEVGFVSDDRHRQFFNRNEENPIETDVIIIDESSMVDIILFHYLLKAIKDGTKLIIVGDVDQLPSVGPGNVLHDIIKSGLIKTVKLIEIFRQARESAIIMNAHRINKGEPPILNQKEKDFFFLERFSTDSVLTTLVDLVTERLPKYKGYDIKKDIQVLSPTRKNLLGVSNLNNLLQKKINPSKINKNEKEFRTTIFREGDKVMQLKNNYNISWIILNSLGKRIDEGTGIFNGDEGIILEINNEDKKMIILFDENKHVVYDFSQLDELDISYAVTVHKSQGSEYKVVVIPIFQGASVLFTRNLLYTAVTRAKELCVIVGSEEMVYSMIENKRETLRYTALDLRIKELSGVLKYTIN